MGAQEIAIWVGAAVATHIYLLWRLWIYYLAVMNLKRVKNLGLLHGYAKIFGAGALIIGYLLDAYLNIVLFTILSGRLPRELTVSERLKKYNRETGTWGKKLAVWFEPLLDPYDPSGDHI